MNKVIYVSDDDQELKDKWKQLEKKAEEKDRSVSWLVNNIISDYVDKK